MSCEASYPTLSFTIWSYVGIVAPVVLLFRSVVSERARTLLPREEPLILNSAYVFPNLREIPINRRPSISTAAVRVRIIKRDEIPAAEFEFRGAPIRYVSPLSHVWSAPLLSYISAVTTVAEFVDIIPCAPVVVL